MTRSFRPSDARRRREPGFGAALGVSAAAHIALVAGMVLWNAPSSGGGTIGPLAGKALSQAGTEVRFLTLKPPAAPMESPDRERLTPPIEVSISPIEAVAPARERRLPGTEEGVPGTLAAPAVGSAGRVGLAGIGGMGTGGTGESGNGPNLLAPRPRYTVLPPLDRPASVRGKSFRVRFWVDQFGRVTRVEVSPEIPDTEYRKKFLALMYQYSFEPARRPDGTPVAGEAVLTITL
ncbi:MAG: hypothetical protein KatS3mg081_2807 [Gemmatimonadales bacterium]|nr:hypothetical protein HRbin33_01808 [bacterium HR33]GIW53452.1 MAG: hypothetical protein KatS3mg081_2807 [Gemmatimonadales bacterium]